MDTYLSCSVRRRRRRRRRRASASPRSSTGWRRCVCWRCSRPPRPRPSCARPPPSPRRCRTAGWPRAAAADWPRAARRPRRRDTDWGCSGGDAAPGWRCAAARSRSGCDGATCSDWRTTPRLRSASSCRCQHATWRSKHRPPGRPTLTNYRADWQLSYWVDTWPPSFVCSFVRSISFVTAMCYCRDLHAIV